MIASVDRLLIYPIKSLDSVKVDKVEVLSSGALAGDRQLAIFDQEGNFVNGKRQPKIHQLRTRFTLNNQTIYLGEESSFHLDTDRDKLESWLGEYFGFTVQIRENLDTGFPDDTISPGPTIISTATLETIASWYENLSVEEVRARFRANIEITGVPPFWEDTLIGKSFLIGEVEVSGINPCQRCVVVTRDSQTGEVYSNFQKIFTTNRKDRLPTYVDTTHFNHFFRLAINTRITENQVNKIIALGDLVKL